jgi:hypothetical protein
MLACLKRPLLPLQLYGRYAAVFEQITVISKAAPESSLHA